MNNSPSLSTSQTFPHRFHNPRGGGEDDVFQIVGGRQRNMRGCYSYWRAGMVVEALIYGDRDNFGAPSTEPMILLDREQPVRFGHRTEDSLGVERHQRAHIDNFAVDSMFRFDLLARFQRARHH